MEKLKIGISHEYAIILRQKTNKGTTYEAVDLIKGFFDAETQYFVDDNGEVYTHFTTFDHNSKEEEYFLGHIQIPEYLFTKI